MKTDIIEPLHSVDYEKRKTFLQEQQAKLNQVLQIIEPGEGICFQKKGVKNVRETWQKYHGNFDAYAQIVHTELFFICKGMRPDQTLDIVIKKY